MSVTLYPGNRYDMTITKTKVVESGDGAAKRRALLVYAETVTADGQGGLSSAWPLGRSKVDLIGLGFNLQTWGFGNNVDDWLGRASVEDLAAALVGRRASVRVELDEDNQLALGHGRPLDDDVVTTLPNIIGPTLDETLLARAISIASDDAREGPAPEVWYDEEGEEHVRDPNVGKVTGAHPETSHAAAELSAEFNGAQRQRVYDAIAEAGASGLTDEEGEQKSGVKDGAYRARRKELYAEGFIENTGTTRLTSAGRKRLELAKENGKEADTSISADVWVTSALVDMALDPDRLRTANVERRRFEAKRQKVTATEVDIAKRELAARERWLTR